MVETLDKYFENVCELDVSGKASLTPFLQIMFNIEKAHLTHFIIDEMVMAGYIVETNKTNILNPVVAVVKSSMQWYPNFPIHSILNDYLMRVLFKEPFHSFDFRLGRWSHIFCGKLGTETTLVHLFFTLLREV